VAPRPGRPSGPTSADLPIGSLAERTLIGQSVRMPGDEPLSRVAALLVLEKQATEALPDVAADALVRGLDSQSLRELAGASASDVRESQDLFWRALGELGIERPAADQARWWLVVAWARDIVEGRMSPFAGARLIWWEGWEGLGRPPELAVFVGLASQWEDDEQRRDQCERDIRDAASDLLADRS
jgi:hypothetical protein